MKKILSLALAVMLLCTMALPASATSTTLTLEYTTALNPSYTLSIPASTTITNANGFNNIGMIGISNSQDLYGYHIDVSCTISDFIGAETNTHVMAFLSYLQSGATEDNLSGDTNSQNGTPTVLSFYEVNEDGTINSVAVDASHTTVDSLHVGVFMDGNAAPSDTYTSVVTFSSDLVLNTQ